MTREGNSFSSMELLAADILYRFTVAHRYFEFYYLSRINQLPVAKVSAIARNSNFSNSRFETEKQLRRKRDENVSYIIYRIRFLYFQTV